MQISITKKLATAMSLKPSPPVDAINPLFCWTANWINTFRNRKEDMIVMVNEATKFSVAIYGIKRSGLKKIEDKMKAAIKNTLLAMNLNHELVEQYLNMAGEITFASNHDRKMTAHVNSRGLDAANVVGRKINDSYEEIKH